MKSSISIVVLVVVLVFVVLVVVLVVLVVVLEVLRKMVEKTLNLMLSSLECPFVNTMNYKSIDHIISLIKWLEDCKIRQLDINDRHILNNINSNGGTNGSIDIYLNNLSIYFNEIKCPYKVLYTKHNDTINMKCLYWYDYYSYYHYYYYHYYC